ncbi:hypothetical protein [Streptosporangium sp. 'caverna']|uniref:hypothetical protein n=1 Tax=Streptosporangium sp. 'caverna' TaxID=2202249 RepID=UPI000D7E2326|nr:hypothetical protein [Streptosporangium sp. 'caverna']AWS44030.1 hypothetical protein DKM19_24450 [Streptosporangium sp. 'caverna']
MRRYPLGWIAAAFVALVVVSGVAAAVTGDAWLATLVVYRRLADRPVDIDGGRVLMLVAVGALQGWGLWQILPGRQGGEKPGRDARRLRIALYVSLAIELADLSWTDIPEEVVQVAVVVLLYRVMRGVSRTLRLVALAAGLYHPALLLTIVLLELFGLDGEALWQSSLGSVPWLVWMVLTLVAQAKDGRWGRVTLWAGAAVVAGPFLVPDLMINSFSRSYVWYAGGHLALDVFTLVWLGRSARDLGNRPRDPRPVTPASPSRRWPLQAVAVALPLLPAVANLADGVFLWIGPRGAIASWFSGWYPMQLWLPFDLLVGTGGAAALVLAAVLRRTRRLVIGTIWALLLAAVAGLATAATTAAGDSRATHGSILIFPDWMFTSSLGISPLWYSLAFTGSALLLLFLYGDRPARRRPYRVLPASMAASAVLVLVPVSDHAPGPITTASDCEAKGDYETGRTPPPPMTGEQAFICTVRTARVPSPVGGMPDRMLVAYGHRLCGVYTRENPQEMARFHKAYGVSPGDETALLADICPKAAETLRVAAEEEEREMLAHEAEEQAKCDQAPRHRPLITPVSAIRQEKPIWPELPLETYEQGGEPEDGPPHQVEGGDLVASAPGHLQVFLNTEYRACVTTEAYDRRPPVETKGWQNVVEVGYESPEGRIVLADNLTGIQLPDLAALGKGHYRVRVHYAWLSWKGTRQGGQRLLIMTYPGRGDHVTVHR